MYKYIVKTNTFCERFTQLSLYIIVETMIKDKIIKNVLILAHEDSKVQKIVFQHEQCKELINNGIIKMVYKSFKTSNLPLSKCFIEHLYFEVINIVCLLTNHSKHHQLLLSFYKNLNITQN